MNWREVQLGDGVHVKHGFAFKGEYFAASGEYLVLTPGNFLEQGGFRVRDGKERFYHADFPEEYLLAEGDLIEVSFRLDDKNNTPVQRQARIRVVRGRFVGAEFTDHLVRDKALGFYLMA